MAEKDGAYVPPPFLHEHQKAMNQLFTSTSRVLAALLFVALTPESAAQSFPLPYNPDENGDGLIGVVDLQGLLSNYGSEFSGTVISEDGENAITYMGEMAYPLCAMACENLPGIWTMPKDEDLGLVWEEVSAFGSQTWLQKESSSTVYLSNSNSHVYSYIEYIGNGVKRYTSNVLEYSLRCYCTARQLPRVEYYNCTSCSYGAFEFCVNPKVEAGWYPLGGVDREGNCFSQAFWRWAE